MTRESLRRALRPVEFMVLSVLADESLHGYGLVKAIEERSAGQVRLRPGNLYRVLDRLIEAGWVTEAPIREGEPSGGGERTRRFAITDAGRDSVGAEARLLTDLIQGSESLSRLVQGGGES